MGKTIERPEDFELLQRVSKKAMDAKDKAFQALLAFAETPTDATRQTWVAAMRDEKPANEEYWKVHGEYKLF